MSNTRHACKPKGISIVLIFPCSSAVAKNRTWLWHPQSSFVTSFSMIILNERCSSSNFRISRQTWTPSGSVSHFLNRRTLRVAEPVTWIINNVLESSAESRHLIIIIFCEHLTERVGDASFSSVAIHVFLVPTSTVPVHSRQDLNIYTHIV
jgi:hypothetical protein